MAVNIYHQLFNLFVFTLTGIIIGTLFDVFRIIRKSFKTSDIITYIEDALFWILAGCILLFTIFTFNNGEIRIYIFIGLIIGIILYLLTISKIFIKISTSILSFLKKVIYIPIYNAFKFINKIIINPIYTTLKNIIVKFTKKISKINKWTKNAKIPKISNKIEQ